MSSTSLPGNADRRHVQRARMPGAAAWFVAFCMVLIAASLSSVIYLRFDVALAEAGWIGFGALMIMVLAKFFAARTRERSAVAAQLNEVELLAIRLAGDVGRIEQRFGELEVELLGRLDEGIESRFSTIGSHFSSIDAALAGIEGNLAELEDRVGAIERHHPRTGEPPADAAAPADPADPAAAGVVESLDTVRRAIAENRVEVFMQPMVQLPQRRVRYYEALTRLRDENGRIILPGAYLPVAEQAGLMPLIDNLLLFRCVQIVRRMVRRAPDLAIFCNLSARSLIDTEFFPQFIDFMEDNRELASALVFEFPQGVLDGLGPVEQAGLDALAALGFRFSVDHVRDLDIDGAAYAARRVRFVKIDARLLLDPPPGGSIHVADLAKLLARSGIELVAGRVESEAELVDLLDFEIPLGQGHLFSPPRPVRAEILGDASSGVAWRRAS